MMNRFIGKLCSSLSVGLVVCASTVYSAPITFSDTEFALANYTNTSGGNSTYSTSLSQITSGGNPGNALEFTLQGSSDLPAFGFNALLNNSFLYNPSGSGAIGSLGFSLDRYNDLQGEFAPGLNARLLAFQNGNLYTFTIIGPPDEEVWRTLSATGVMSDNFSQYNPSTNLFDTNSHPDFSSSGSLIQFGFLQRFSIPGSGPYDVPIPVEQRFDNYVLTIRAINEVPEPSTLLLLASGIVGMVVLGRRYSRS